MWTYFKKEEFECKCGCGFNEIDDTFVTMLDRLRAMVGTALVVNSGCRCEQYNRLVGGKPASAHLDGYAADIACKNSSLRFDIIEAALEIGITRIGVYPTFIHLDIDPKKPRRVLWPDE